MRKQVLAVTIGVLLVLSVFSVLQFWQIKPAQATQLFNNGFEEGQCNPSPGVWTSNTTTATYGSLTVQSTTKHTGTYALNATITDQAGWTNAYCSKTLASTNNLTYVRPYIYIDSFASSEILRGFIWIVGTGGQIGYLGLTPSRALFLRYWVNDPVDTWRENTSATTLSLDTQYSVEMNYSADNDATGDGSIEVYLNDVNVTDLAQSSFTQSGNAMIESVSVGISSGYSTNASILIDDVIISSSKIGLQATQYSLTVQSTPISVSYNINGTDSGYTVYPATGGIDALQVAINDVHAHGNGTVHVPAGTFTFNWNNSKTDFQGDAVGVISYGGVNIIGAGAGITILKMTQSLSTSGQSMLYVDGTNNLPYRISGITFQGYMNSSDEGTGPNLVTCARSTDFRVDNCAFDNFSMGVQALGRSWGDPYPNRGLVDHCNFSESYKNATFESGGYGVYVWNTESSKWSTFSTLIGNYSNAQDMVYIEDCLFTEMRHCAVAGQNGYYVARFNNVTEERPENFGSWDVHGFTYGRGAEIYNNTVTGSVIPHGGADAVWLRGGESTVFNNTFINCTNGVAVYNESAVFYQVNDTYIWNNNMTGGGNAFYDASAGAYTENVTYFLYERPSYTTFTYPHPSTLNTAGTTNDTLTLDTGTYLVTVPSEVTVSGNTYDFSKWQDDSTDTTLTITLTTDTEITATYVPAYFLTITVTSPTNTTYTSPSVPLNFTASGGTIDHKWWNCTFSNSTLVYANTTYTTETTITLANSGYIINLMANTTDGNENVETVMFTVSVIGGTTQIIVNTWWSNY